MMQEIYELKNSKRHQLYGHKWRQIIESYEIQTVLIYTVEESMVEDESRECKEKAKA